MKSKHEKVVDKAILAAADLVFFKMLTEEEYFEILKSLTVLRRAAAKMPIEEMN